MFLNCEVNCIYLEKRFNDSWTLLITHIITSSSSDPRMPCLIYSLRIYLRSLGSSDHIDWTQMTHDIEVVRYWYHSLMAVVPYVIFCFLVVNNYILRKWLVPLHNTYSSGRLKKKIVDSGSFQRLVGPNLTTKNRPFSKSVISLEDNKNNRFF